MTDSENLPPTDEGWRHLLADEMPFLESRRLHARMPSNPRCKFCAAPFSGPGGLVMRLQGRQRWAQNPKYCAFCFKTLREHHGGAEIECSLLFADVRGSTSMAERIAPREFTRLMGRFFDIATEAVVDQDGIVDKFVGDEIVAIFVPSMASERHAERAIAAGRRMLAETGFGSPGGPWLPIGVGVNTGVAYVGSIGTGLDTDLTAMGDAVNVTARLASAAGAGEILVTEAAASAAGLAADLPRRSLELKGKSEPVEVAVLAFGASSAPDPGRAPGPLNRKTRGG